MNWFIRQLNKIATHQWFRQLSNGKYVWQAHLDNFFSEMLQYMPEMSRPEFDTGSEYESDFEELRHVFAEWLAEVPDELKMGEELHPYLKEQVGQYVLNKYGFNPYDREIDEMEAPSAESLENWWS